MAVPPSFSQSQDLSTRRSKSKTGSKFMYEAMIVIFSVIQKTHALPINFRPANVAAQSQSSDEEVDHPWTNKSVLGFLFLRRTAHYTTTAVNSTWMATGENSHDYRNEPMSPLSNSAESDSDSFTPQSDDDDDGEDIAQQPCEKSKRIVERGQKDAQSSSSRDAKEVPKTSKNGERKDTTGTHKTSDNNKYKERVKEKNKK
ncbi:hypothetical protein EV363DRAFT_1414804 [Boletus edulis]|nr:hypothetical protein EV363DRAFT_1414804 [Boletus edulis]